MLYSTNPPMMDDDDDADVSARSDSEDNVPLLIYRGDYYRRVGPAPPTAKPSPIARLGGFNPLGAWTPKWVADCVDPQSALRYRFSELECFSVQLEERTGSGGGSNSGSGGGTLKKLTLGRKKKAEKLERRAELDSRQRKFRVTINQLQRVNDEVERIATAIPKSAEAFSVALCTLLDERSVEWADSIQGVASHFIVDHTVTQHPHLKALQMPDNRLLLHTGGAMLDAFVYAKTVADHHRLQDAERHAKDMRVKAGVWAIERLGQEAANAALPLAWTLAPDTHEPLVELDLAAREKNRLMRELPLLMLGVLHQLSTPDRAERLLRLMYRDCI